jgi:SAM-dependent methyltransferase
VKSAAETGNWKRLLWQRLWRRPIVKKVFYEVLGLLLARRRGMQMLNCGFQEAGFPALPLDAEAGLERLGFQLYHRLAGSAGLGGARVFEVGCGRGGGARYLAEHFHPLSYTATDSSRSFVLANRLRRHPAQLDFRFARATRLPFGPSSRDIGIAVEAIHPLPDKPAFLSEAARVLRPGGKLLVADFFYTRDDSPNAIAGFRRAIAGSPFRAEVDEDWTPQATAALEADSPRRLAEIDRLPRIFHALALSFACTSASPLYHQLHDGRAVYAHFELSRK